MGLIGNMSVKDNIVLKATDSPEFSSAKGYFLKKKAIRDYALKMQKYDIRAPLWSRRRGTSPAATSRR